MWRNTKCSILILYRLDNQHRFLRIFDVLPTQHVIYDQNHFVPNRRVVDDLVILDVMLTIKTIVRTLGVILTAETILCRLDVLLYDQNHFLCKLDRNHFVQTSRVVEDQNHLLMVETISLSLGYNAHTISTAVSRWGLTVRRVWTPETGPQGITAAPRVMAFSQGNVFLFYNIQQFFYI